MTRPTIADPGSEPSLVQASERWVKGFATATLDPASAPDLVESAQRVTQVVAHAARHLTWQTPDSFMAAMRQAELSGDC